MIRYFYSEDSFELESGGSLDGLQIAYSVYGDHQSTRTIWVCHALSGSSEVLEWWPGLFGEHQLFSPLHHRIICANVIGGCYGSTGPGMGDAPEDFPVVTIRDMVRAHRLLADALGIQQIDILIGASLGGQQALEWAVQEPGRIRDLILIATNATHSPFGKSFNEAQRLALTADPTYGIKGGGQAGLKGARAMAMLSYRSYEDFQIRQSDTGERLHDYRAASYVRYQGEKFADRFEAVSYHRLTLAMDSHDISRGRGTIGSVLATIKARTLVLGVSSDILFPLGEQALLADLIPGARLEVIHSHYGHDAFLIEYDRLNLLLSGFLFQGYPDTGMPTGALESVSSVDTDWTAPVGSPGCQADLSQKSQRPSVVPLA